jgi:hypothetical protein
MRLRWANSISIFFRSRRDWRSGKAPHHIAHRFERRDIGALSQVFASQHTAGFVPAQDDGTFHPIALKRTGLALS